VTNRFDVLGLGLNSQDQIISLGMFPAPGEKVRYTRAVPTPGGQVAVACVACQRHGLRSRYAGCVGDDAAGTRQYQALAAEGVELSALRVVPATASQQAAVFLETSGERTIVFERSAALVYPPEAVSPAWIASGTWLLVDGYDAATAAHAAQLARVAGTRVLADLSFFQPGDREPIESLLRHTDDLICSQRFPASFLGVHCPLDALPLLRTQYGLARATITLGRDGVLGLDAEGWHYSPAFVVRETDTTGAGDVFHGGFLVAQQHATCFSESLTFAAALAALNCTERGARGHIATGHEVATFLSAAARHPTPDWLRHLALAQRS